MGRLYLFSLCGYLVDCAKGLKKRKKGDLEIRYLILFILAVLVLVVVALIFSKQIGIFLGKIKGIWEQLEGIDTGLEQLKD
ncbi:hypothetical protein HZB88_01135 [archaeon]|nr:hypothetical protein [archaeon]